MTLIEENCMLPLTEIKLYILKSKEMETKITLFYNKII